MSNVASLELSKKLYELSGWEDKSKGGWEHTPTAPYYDAGYLLRKLPAIVGRYSNYSLQIHKWRNHYSASYIYFMDERGIEKTATEALFFEKADTPEDALCKLSIKLIEEGIL